MNIAEIVTLSDLLAKLHDVRRGTNLPSGEAEPDSHHSFSLALIAYDVCSKHCPELDLNKVVLFALTHDLLEIITGDEDTLHATPEALEAKRLKEEAALEEFNKLFSAYPALCDAMHEYERLDTSEAATVFVLDKACTTWTHFHDKGHYAKTKRNLRDKQSIEQWADRQRNKIAARLKVQPPKAILDVYEESFVSLCGLFDD